MSLRTKASPPLPTTESTLSKDGRFQCATRHPKWSGSKLPDNTEMQYGQLTLQNLELHRVGHQHMVLAHCSITKVTRLVNWHNVKAGKTKSFLPNGRGLPNVVYARIAARFDEIRYRCTRQGHPKWSDYGGRGITCFWQTRKEFTDWVLVNLPHPTYIKQEIDRIDNNGNYEPGNLRLASRQEQCQNRRNTLWVQTNEGPVLLNKWPSPYAIGVTGTYVRRGLTGEQILAHAWRAVANKCKGWRVIQAKLESMTL